MTSHRLHLRIYEALSAKQYIDTDILYASKCCFHLSDAL